MSKKIYDHKRCYEIAQQCSSSTEMQKLNGSAYNAARSNGWIKEYTWFTRKQHTPYTYNEVFEMAQKYTCSSDFQKGNGSAYGKAREKGWIKDYTWFTIKQRPPHTEEECLVIAKKYKSRLAFARGNAGTYNSALKNGWLERYTWFESKQRPYNYWSKQRVTEEAHKYHSKKEFREGCATAYNKARENGWFVEFPWLKDDRIDFHNDKIDCVYAYEFVDLNSVYVGRTLIRRVQKRNQEHIYTENDAVVKFAKEHSIPVPPMIILEDNLTLKEGTEKEGYYLELYRDKGWNTINRAKTGGVGLIFRNKWTKKTCYQEALKYKSRGEFAKQSSRAYDISRTNGWLDSYTWFEELQKPSGYWEVYENCYIAASECNNKKEFGEKYSAAYYHARKNGWMKDYPWLNTPRRSHNKKWDYNTVLEEAKKYTSRKEFKTNANGAYSVARKNGWLDLYDWFEDTHTLLSRQLTMSWKHRKEK